MARKNRSSSRGIKRKVSTIEPNKSILLVLEGEVTERLYFQELRRQLKLTEKRLEFKIQEECSGDPKSLIEYAEKHEAQRIKDKNPNAKNFDEIWLIFDLDTVCRGGNNKQKSQRISQIQNLESNYKKKHWFIGYSNPSFEYFLYLHFHYSSRAFTNEELRKELKILPDYVDLKTAKKLEGSTFLKRIVSQWKTAHKNALKIQGYHEDANSKFPDDLPNTKLGSLLGKLSSHLDKQ